jgi:hypothetical protein
MSYCLAYDVKAHLGVDSPGDDQLLTAYIAGAQAWIDEYCHRTFEAPEDTTRYIDAAGNHLRGRVLYIDHIGELCSITEVTNGDGIVVASEDYVTTPRFDTPIYALRLKMNSGLIWQWTNDWEDAISITGRWAYSITAPAPIKQACIQLAAFYYRQKDAPFTDVTAVEAGVVIRPMGIPAHVKAMLDPYRKP